jgi:Domain of unknown function (DUF5619)
MKSIALETDLPVGFELAKRLADAVATACLGESVCLSWYDRASDQESPSHASDCHGSCETPGYLEYAAHRGADLKVVVQSGAFVFCFMPLGGFAAPAR